MNTNAYSVLDAIGLRRPRTFSVDDLLVSGSDFPSKLYLRWRQPSRRKNLVATAHAKNRVDSLRRASEEGSLLQIEESVKSELGGCAVKGQLGIYLEVVSGHLSGLLIDGWCCHRTWCGRMARASLDSFVPQVHQSELTESGLKRVASRVSSPELPNAISRDVLHLLDPIDSLGLFEFVVSLQKGVYFVDFKKYPWAVNFECLLNAESNGEQVVYSESSDDEGPLQVYSGPLNFRNLEQLRASRYEVIIGDNALLAHFITHGLESGIIHSIRR